MIFPLQSFLCQWWTPWGCFLKESSLYSYSIVLFLKGLPCFYFMHVTFNRLKKLLGDLELKWIVGPLGRVMQVVFCEDCRLAPLWSLSFYFTVCYLFLVSPPSILKWSPINPPPYKPSWIIGLSGSLFPGSEEFEDLSGGGWLYANLGIFWQPPILKAAKTYLL